VDRELPSEVLAQIRTIMWQRVGIVRNGEDLAAAVADLDALEAELANHTTTSARNILLTGRLIARAALLREESLGSHFREDFPSRSEGPPRHSIVALARNASGGVRTSMDATPAWSGFRERAGV
jgi:L-aspartate oxidase